MVTYGFTPTRTFYRGRADGNGRPRQEVGMLLRYLTVRNLVR